MEFRFDPTTRQTNVSVGGQNANIGAQPLDTRDNPYSAYVSLNQLDNQNSAQATQFGVAHLYDFSLDKGKVNEVSILAGRELVFVPPLPPV